MVCDECSKKLGKIITPNINKDDRDVAKNTLLGKKKYMYYSINIEFVVINVRTVMEELRVIIYIVYIVLTWKDFASFVGRK